MRRWLSLPRIIAVLGIATSGADLQAQRISLDAVITTDTALRHSVRLRDGTVLVGRIVSITTDSVRTELETGVVAVPRSAIREGRYTVSWRVQAADGHTQRGSWTFRVVD